jgi:hypothetical protein
MKRPEFPIRRNENLGEKMSKEPKIDHEYHAGKDKLKITIQGYALSKKARVQIMKKLIAEVERKPDRLIAAARKKSAKGRAKELQVNKRNPSWSRLASPRSCRSQTIHPRVPFLTR